MTYLLDTHALVWWLADDRRLGRKARAAIASPRATTFVSAASIWEMAIKASLGKLRLRASDAGTLAQLPLRCGFSDLAISAAHAAAVQHLAFHHHDPFDRLLVAQALAEDLVIVTSDSQFDKYAARLLDASR